MLNDKITAAYIWLGGQITDGLFPINAVITRPALEGIAAAFEELMQLRGVAERCRANHTRTAINGVKRAGRTPSGLTAAQKSALDYASRKFRAAWYKAGRPELATWLPEQIAALPDDVRALRTVNCWLKLAAKWN